MSRSCDIFSNAPDISKLRRDAISWSVYAIFPQGTSVSK